MPPSRPARKADSHISGPPTQNESTSMVVAMGMVVASRRRRPVVSAIRPPMTNPNEAGVAVVRVNAAIPAPL